MTMELQAALTAAAAVDVWPNGECVSKRSAVPNPSLGGCDRANVCAITAPLALGVLQVRRLAVSFSQRMVLVPSC